MDVKTEDVMKFHDGLSREKFWGRITEHWQNGEIVLIERQQTFKPADFEKVTIEFKIS